MTTGRFTQEDPIRCGLNWYTYCMNNPIMFSDPTGLSPFFPECPDTGMIIMPDNMHPPASSTSSAPLTLHDEIFNFYRSQRASNSGHIFVTAGELREFGWIAGSNSDIYTDAMYLNAMMTWYGINLNAHSMTMFLATIMDESGRGRHTLERLNLDGTRAGHSSVRHLVGGRGAGFMQISDGRHAEFLSYIGSSYTGNTAEYIANNRLYSWLSAGWFWTQVQTGLGTGDGLSGFIHDYIAHHGGGAGVFLTVTYAVNGWQNSNQQALRAAVGGTNFAFTPTNTVSSGGLITVSGFNSFRAPYGWAVRTNYFNRARSIWA